MRFGVVTHSKPDQTLVLVVRAKRTAHIHLTGRVGVGVGVGGRGYTYASERVALLLCAAYVIRANGQLKDARECLVQRTLAGYQEPNFD